MFRILIIFTAFSLAFSGVYNFAHAQNVEKNSFYFMKDDGVFSHAEKDEEAQFIYQRCSSNIMQRVYFDCGCVAGAFRLIRDQDKKLRPQQTILNEIYNDRSYNCVDKITIAGNSFKFCANYVDAFRTDKNDNGRYCKCVANTVANEFEKKPLLRTRHVENLRTEAMVSCNRPTGF
ncbi:MAG: hypothetical protein AAF988_04825 [Pseudomonadota bacterium]